MTRDAAFYFANLGADVARCANAARHDDISRYDNALARAYRTLERLHTAARPEAYEEGLLMLRGLALARATPERLASFQSALDSIISPFSASLGV
ncbi:MAG TPA: hypothetical protein VNF51_02230 [Candidatus Paceibacterota bacterium]|nr:hypothetical protein [Candidatus Paceibacterota bacterium]